MSEPPPLLDGESPWPVSTGTLGRTHTTAAVEPVASEPVVHWTYDHGAELVAPPVVTADGDLVLLDGTGRLSLVSSAGKPGWSTTLEVAPVEAFNSPAVWRRDGRTLVSITHAGGVSFVEPGEGVVEDVAIGAPARFLCLRDDGLVSWSREAIALLDDAGEIADEHRFVWRSDDVACPTIGPDGAVYFLENREYAPSWDAEDQFLEVARVSFDGGAERESVVSVHAHTTDAVGAVCATAEALFWILDSWRVGYSAIGGEVQEVDADAFPRGAIPSRIVGGHGTTALIQREEAGQPVYALRGGDLSTWPVEEPVDAAVIDVEGTAYLLAGGRLCAVGLDGASRWSTAAVGRWLTAAGTLLLSDADGSITCFGGSA